MSTPVERVTDASGMATIDLAGRKPSGEQVRRTAVTIKDVAAASGVSAGTVSNALAGNRGVSPATRARVLEVARRLGYQPSDIARGLRSGRMWTIGLLLAEINNPFSAEIARGVEEVAVASDCALILCNTDYDVRKEANYLALLESRRIGGVIIMSSHADDPNIVALAERDDLPFVLLSRRHQVVKAPYVGTDNTAGTLKATRHLLQLGHQQIAFIRGATDSTAAEARRAGWELALREFGLEARPDWIQFGNYTIEGGRQATERLLALEQPPTAIVAANDLMAFGALEAISIAGKRVPQDISVVGFDDIPWAAYHLIQLTTVRQPMQEMGAAAARMLLRRMANKAGPEEPEELIFKPELIVRNTTGPPPR